MDSFGTMNEYMDMSELERRLTTLEEAVKCLPEFSKRQEQLEMRMDLLESCINKAIINIMPKLDEALTNIQRRERRNSRVTRQFAVNSAASTTSSSAVDVISSSASSVATTTVESAPTITTAIGTDNVTSTPLYATVLPHSQRHNSQSPTNHVTTVFVDNDPTFNDVTSSGVIVISSDLNSRFVHDQTNDDTTSSVEVDYFCVDESQVEEDTYSSMESIMPAVEATLFPSDTENSSGNAEYFPHNNSPSLINHTHTLNNGPQPSHSIDNSFNNAQEMSYNTGNVSANNNNFSNNARHSSEITTGTSSSSNHVANSTVETNPSFETSPYATVNHPSMSSTTREINLRRSSIPVSSISNPVNSRFTLPPPRRSAIPRPSLASTSSSVFLPSVSPNTSTLNSADPPTSQLQISPILTAAALGDAYAIREILSSPSSGGDKVEERDAHGDTALHVSATHGHVEALLALLAAWANADARGRRLRTPLHCAAACGHARIVRRLLRAGANPSAIDADGATALLLAAGNGHVDAVSALINKGATTKIKDKGGLTPAIWAASMGHSEVLITLIQTGGVSPDECDAQGHPLVVHAARSKHWNVVRLLLQNGASMTTCKNPEDSALAHAAQDGQIDIIREILQHGASTESAQVRKALASAKTAAVIWAFVDAAPDVLRGDAGRLALLNAAVDGRLEVLSALLEAGVDVGVEGEGQVEAMLALLVADGHTLRRKEKKSVFKGFFRKSSKKVASVSKQKSV